MDRYYYLVAQLPSLDFGKQPELTVGGFLQEAEKWVSATHYAELSGVRLGVHHSPAPRSRAFRAYTDFEQTLHRDLAGWREGQRLGIIRKPLSFPPSLVEEGDPLEVEIKLLRYQWEFVDLMQRESHFDLAFLVCYTLKLHLLDRYFTFDREQGRSVYQKATEVTP